MTILVILGVLLLCFAAGYWRFLKKEYPLTTETQIPPEQIVSQMSLNRKLKQLTGETMLVGAIKMILAEYIIKELIRFYSGYDRKWKIPAFCFTDGPRGIAIEKNNTAWPVSLARGASFDADLEERIGVAIAKEAKRSGANYFAGITINLLRHPRWGRAQESYGEDPWLLGTMGTAVVKGVQSRNVMACAKHYALNSIENSRFYVDVEADERTLREVYLYHFKKVVQEGKVASLMSSYNLVNGRHVSENPHLLNTILRKDWGFEGFVSSDWLRGVRNGAESVRAGNEVEMPVPRFSGLKLKKALKNGEISMAEIDEAVLRVIRTKIEYGSRSRREDFRVTRHPIPEHFEMARESAEKSAVLMQNKGMLPLDPGQPGRLLVLGTLADKVNLGDDGSSNKVQYTYVVTPLKGLRTYLKDKPVRISYYDGADPAEAARMAGEADAVIVVAGFTPRIEGEYFSAKPDGPGEKMTDCGGDRTSLDLLESDIDLIRSAGRANSNTLVVYQGGSAIVTDPWEKDVNAVVFQWYPGMEGGNALARLLFGETNFSGKLPFTIVKKESDLPFFDSETTKIRYDYYHGYTLMDKKNIEPAYPFGYGLSYTNYRYGDLRIPGEDAGPEDTIRIEAQVTNTGEREGEEVVFLFAGFENSSVDRPVKLLRGFQRVALKPGESKTISFSLHPRDLTYYDPKEKKWVLENMPHRIFLGGSADPRDLLSSMVTIKS